MSPPELVCGRSRAFIACALLTAASTLVACARKEHSSAANPESPPTPSSTDPTPLAPFGPAPTSSSRDVTPSAPSGPAPENVESRRDSLSPEVRRHRELCDDGTYESCASLGWAYYTGEGAPLDHPRAHELFDRACSHHVERGCVPLGYMYQTGDVVPKDLERAVSLLTPACQRGKAQVCIGLGELYEKERGDPRTAIQWFHKACAGGASAGCAAEQRLRAK